MKLYGMTRTNDSRNKVRLSKYITVSECFREYISNHVHTKLLISSSSLGRVRLMSIPQESDCQYVREQIQEQESIDSLTS